ncbi:hypothetical protein TNCV_4522311 [Trichonephila clavipes]|nr:hypothetical protein TNCV_4522311 [Trichonephila clavipes]
MKVSSYAHLCCKEKNQTLLRPDEKRITYKNIVRKRVYCGSGNPSPSTSSTKVEPDQENHHHHHIRQDNLSLGLPRSRIPVTLNCSIFLTTLSSGIRIIWAIGFILVIIRSRECCEHNGTFDDQYILSC